MVTDLSLDEDGLRLQALHSAIRGMPFSPEEMTVTSEAEKEEECELAPGQEWAYRVRDDAPSSRVRVLALQREGRKFRIEVRHLDGSAAGTTENVPRNRLKVPWSEVSIYDIAMEGWKTLREQSIDSIESSALWAVLSSSSLTTSPSST